MNVPHNYLPGQYAENAAYTVNHNYLVEQFSDYPEIFRKIEELVRTADYTLGKAVDAFEARIAALTGSRWAVGTGSGTDALMLSMKALGVGAGDEVITTPYTFYATAGAIVTAGARPVFVDIRPDYNIDPDRIESAVTEKTRAIVPVHWAGLVCDMDAIGDVARRHGLFVIEDACHGICATYRGRHAGTFGDAGCFSLHPLKNLNVWGDGGFVVTDAAEVRDRLVLLRNHGLKDRDRCVTFAYNSRLDSIQAVVADHLLDKIDHITQSRIANAALYDGILAETPQVAVPRRADHVRQVYHLYVIRAENRDELQRFLRGCGVDAKVHYPVPLHLQPAASAWGYRRGDFPVCEAVCDSVLSLPVHEFVTEAQIRFVCSKIREFYAKR